MTDDKRREAVMEMFGGWDWTAGETANWPAAEALYDAGASHADSTDARLILARRERDRYKQALAKVKARVEDPCEHPDEVPEDILAILAKLERGSDA